LIRNLWHNLENLPKPSPSKHGHVQQHIIFIKPANLFTHFIANKDDSKGCQLKKMWNPSVGLVGLFPVIPLVYIVGLYSWFI
jgi:hypothetical protein